MSKQKPPSLSYRITTEQVLDLMRYYSGADLKAQQSKLTSTATQLEKLAQADRGLGELLELAERDVLKQAAVLIKELNVRVERAKEIKVREEKRRAKERDEYSKAVNQALYDRFPPVTEDSPDKPERLLAIVELHLGLFECNFLEDYWDDGKSSHFGRDFDRWEKRQETLTYIVNVSSQNLRSDLNYRLEYLERAGERGDKSLTAAQALQDVLEAADQKRDVVRLNNPALFEYIERLLAIEKASNVERLPLRSKYDGRGI